jgi:hypothetical protein
MTRPLHAPRASGESLKMLRSNPRPLEGCRLVGVRVTGAKYMRIQVTILLRDGTSLWMSLSRFEDITARNSRRARARTTPLPERTWRVALDVLLAQLVGAAHRDATSGPTLEWQEKRARADLRAASKSLEAVVAQAARHLERDEVLKLVNVGSLWDAGVVTGVMES